MCLGVDSYFLVVFCLSESTYDALLGFGALEVLKCNVLEISAGSHSIELETMNTKLCVDAECEPDGTL